MKFVSTSPKDTLEFAKDLAKTFEGGEVVLLFGQLGAGKTVFAKGVALGLGVCDTVSSPTFAIMNLYKGERLSLCHCDAYRLVGEAGEVTEFFGERDVVSVIEWPERLGDFFDNLPHTKVQINYVDADKREILIEKVL